MLTSGQLVAQVEDGSNRHPIAIQSRSNRPNSTTPTRIVASNCPLFPQILCSDFIPNEQPHLAWPAATIPTTCRPGHAPPSSHPQGSAAICNLHPAGSFASQQPPKRASPQKARPSHALSSLQPSRPITHLALELQSVGFILSFHSLSCSIVFHGFTRVLHHFTLHSSLPKSIGGRSRGESNPTITQLPPGTSASKSLKIDHGGHPN